VAFHITRCITECVRPLAFAFHRPNEFFVDASLGQSPAGYNSSVMTLTQVLIQTGVTFVAASLGAIFGAFLTRRTESFKHIQELRSAAYADFLSGFAKVVRAQNEKRDEASKLKEREGMVLVTDSRSRITIYGGDKVVSALADFISRGTQTLTPQGMVAFARLCTAMRAEAGRKGASFEDISKILFSEVPDA